MGNETGISRQKRPPAAQQPAASQSLTKDGPVSLNPSQDLDDTASGSGTTPDGDTTQGGGTTPDGDTTQGGGSTPDDDTTPGGGTTPDDDTTQDGGSTPDDDTTTPGGGTTQGGITIPGGGVEEALTLTVRYYIEDTNTPIAAPTAGGGTENLLDYVPDKKDVPQGMQFAGWCLPGDDMEAGVTAPENATMPAGALTLYALWVPVTHTVTFESNGGTPVASPKRAMRCPWGCSSPWRWQRPAASPRCWCCANAAANKPPNSARKHGKAALHQQGGLVDCRKS